MCKSYNTYIYRYVVSGQIVFLYEKKTPELTQVVDFWLLDRALIHSLQAGGLFPWKTRRSFGVFDNNRNRQPCLKVFILGVEAITRKLKNHNCYIFSLPISIYCNKYSSHFGRRTSYFAQVFHYAKLFAHTREVFLKVDLLIQFYPWIIIIDSK